MPGGSQLLETNNTLEHPTGPEYQLVVGEGTYVLSDDLHLATPPPHPSDAPQPNNNPLSTNLGPTTAGTRLSIANIAPRRPLTQNLFRSITGASTRSQLPQSIQEEAQSPRSDAGSTPNGFGSAGYYNHTATLGDGNPALQVPPVKTKKGERLKPKNNIVKSNSSYVSRVIPHEALSKRLSERSPDGNMIFANINRAFLWLDLAAETKQENLTKVLFTKAHVLCHDVNPCTISSTHIDVALGFNTSDIIWYEPVSQKYARLNKNGIINRSAISKILWVPNKDNLLVAAHMDGTLVVYDKEREDAEFNSEEEVASPDNANDNDHHESHTPKEKFQIKKSVQSRNQRTNPVAVWKASNMKINSLAFSPDGQLLAIVGEDGTLTIFDYINERVLDVYRSYYGALICVTWSPDGRYVLTGGQDDLVSIWSIHEQALVARCVGHHSWVTDVKFDAWRCDERNYRFGSITAVGLQRRHAGRPKAMSTVATNRGPSVSSHKPSYRKESTHATVTRLRSNSSRSQADGEMASTVDGDSEATEATAEAAHPVDSMRTTAVLPPVMNKVVDEHPLSWVGFEEDCIITSCRDGHIREWQRPKEGADGAAVGELEASVSSSGAAS
ncbi:putative catabolite repression protein creC [Teratosphaeria destructans]|uniref:Catabolite repression protein creC n=1 Tax=Teratosphaeria destructans TaxID=418781 RepID=A0A9W7SSE1_9PEZI|nr:putative catabolite repression protein creC [Teratosphaeria destructans]